MAAGLASGLEAPARIETGAGALERLGTIARDLGTHALLVTGQSNRTARAGALLADAGVRWTRFAVDGEPTVDTARAGTAAALAAGCDLVIGFGGGSALDAAKAIAALVANGGDPLDYLEVVGRGKALTRPSLPFVAIPTTAGTGSEVTKNAVLASPEHGVKASLRSPLMLARAAIVDPDLLAGLPPAVLASSGVDALSQVIEPFLSIRATPATDPLAREGIRRSAAALPRAHAAARAGQLIDPVDRQALAQASVLGGLCLANAGLGAVHGFAAPLGGMFSAPHGAVCAALLPAVLRVNARAVAARSPDGPAHARFRELATMLTGRDGASIDDGIDWVASLCRALEIPGLARYGLTVDRIPELVAKSRAASSMKGNPIALTDDELTEIARASL
ncbi:MAG TPA: iron-containing alcohol dehydrogenase [Polyangia bacterium]|jgi:alcohol dehydrogenase class IV|nr:iron-containing alcohol dehydrogenase [Polyangia bacterium]